MNPHQDLETALRGLPLPQPSPGIRHRLFGPPVSVPAAAQAQPRGPATPRPEAQPWHLWFAPVAATALCVLSAATLLPAPVTASRTLAAALPSPAVAWRPPVGQVERNALPRPSFRSTTGAAVASSFGSLLLRQTNVLAR